MSALPVRKVILLPSDRASKGDVRRFKLARIATPDPRRGSDDRFAHLKRAYD